MEFNISQSGGWVCVGASCCGAGLFWVPPLYPCINVEIKLNYYKSLKIKNCNKV